MKTNHSRFIALFVLVGILLVVLTINITTSGSFQNNLNAIPPTLPKTDFTSTPTRPSYCVPLPYTVRNTFTRTPTPDRALGTVPPAAFAPSVTPIVFSNTFDLDPSISQDDEGSVIVFSCNGSWDFYWLAPNRDFNQSIPLAEGDYIWMVNPPTSIMGKRPPEITRTIITPTFVTSTVVPSTTAVSSKLGENKTGKHFTPTIRFVCRSRTTNDSTGAAARAVGHNNLGSS